MPRTSRRTFLSLAAAGTAAALSRPSWASVARLKLAIHTGQPTFTVPEDFMGLSYELSQLAHTGFFDGGNPVLASFMRTLGGKGVLRIGGNTSEFSVWSDDSTTPDAADNATVSPDAGNGNTRLFTVSPRSICNLNSFLEATDWKLIYGLNLARGTPDSAAKEAAYIAQTCGRRLLAFQIGNEPDLFKHDGDPHHPWTYAEFFERWKRFEQAIRALVPDAPIAGPDISYRSEWGEQFARDTKGLACLLTSHYYAEGPPTDPRMTLDYLLNDRTRFNEEVLPSIEASRRHGIPFRLAESNSCYHAGKPGVSDTFGSALWAGDLLAELAASGVTGVNMHGGGNGLYTPIAGSPQEGFYARPMYYGMLMTRVLAGSTVLHSELSNGGMNVTAYAAKSGDHVFALLFNKGDRPASIAIELASDSGASSNVADVARLLAPSPNATTGVRFAGSTVSSDGAWTPQQEDKLHLRGGKGELLLPPYSAARVSFRSTTAHLSNITQALAVVVLFVLSLTLHAQQTSSVPRKAASFGATQPATYYTGSQEGSLAVEATRWQDAQARRGDDQWQKYPTRVLEQLKDFQPASIPLDQYGGREDIAERATGFYHTAFLHGRWWAIDPGGHPYLNVAVAGVTPGTSAREQKALTSLFGNEQGWLEATHSLLLDNGFHALGAWGDTNELRQAKFQTEQPLSYTVIVNFTYLYTSKSRKFPNSGGYPDAWMKGAIPVFDPDYPVVIDQIARNFAKYKDDKNLFGYFLDNELPFTRQNLDAYLAMPKKDPGYLAATNWLNEHHARFPNDQLRAEFLEYEAELYFRITSEALRRYDPNHMILGSRFTEPEYALPELFRAAGKHCDIVSVNFYTHWTPDAGAMDMWAAAAGKPFLITEFYTKGIDSGLPNFSGAGWLVHTQADRGAAYQNVTLALLQSKGSVGWQFFRYQDNDPTDTSKPWDTSNLDSNKGLVDFQYRVWKPLVERQRQINLNVYALADYFGRHTSKP